MLRDSDIGRRVVVRHRLEPSTVGARFTDVTGRLDDVTDRLLRIGRDDGSRVNIDRSTVIAAKPIPPKRVSYTAVADWEAACDAGWPAPETKWIGRWLLRTAQGFTRRANSVLVLGDPGIDLDTALDRVRAFYDAAGQPVRFSLAQPLTRRLDHTLAERGWSKEGAALVQTAAIERVAGASPASIADEPDADWLRFGFGEPATLVPATTAVLGTGPRRGFAKILMGGETIAVGRGAVENTTVLISSVKVSPDHRRRGLAGHIVAGLAEWAGRLGATRACVQVEQDNAAALSMYARLGFTTHHDYHYRRAP